MAAPTGASTSHTDICGLDKHPRAGVTGQLNSDIFISIYRTIKIRLGLLKP